MKIIIPICESDRQSLTGFIWAINHYGPYPDHELMVVHGRESRAVANEVFDEISNSFPTSSCAYEFPGEIPRGWPLGPNTYWKKTIELLRDIHNSVPWLWMEADLVPLKKDWPSILEAEYKRAGKPFMGCVEPNKLYTQDNIMLKTGEHLVGIGIYPAEVDRYSDNWQHVDRIKTAFDWVCGYEMVPHTHHTPMILNAFRTQHYQIKEGKITCRDTSPDPSRVSYTRPITRDTVLHHGCKDGTLVQLLRDDRVRLSL